MKLGARDRRRLWIDHHCRLPDGSRPRACASRRPGPLDADFVAPFKAPPAGPRSACQECGEDHVNAGALCTECAVDASAAELRRGASDRRPRSRSPAPPGGGRLGEWLLDGY